MIAEPPKVEDIDPATFLIGAVDRQSQFLALARWHFEQRALCALLQSDDEEQAFRLIHHTDYCQPNRAFADRVMTAWDELGSLTDAIKSMDDQESWQIRCRDGELSTISLTESTAHAAIVALGKEYHGRHC